jgi:hypothetical protein
MQAEAARSNSRFQVSLLYFFLWVTAVAVVCGLGRGVIQHLRDVEAKGGSIPAEVVGQSLFLAFLVASAFAGLMIGPPLCFLTALWRARSSKRDR